MASLKYKFFVMVGLVGNILLLLPVPIVFKLDWKKVKKWSFILLLPLAIECLQYLYQVGAADVDDYILNASGCAIGFWIHKKRI
jgi:glycopeptide antibiotics resistance protein